MCEGPKCLHCGIVTKIYASSGLSKKYCSQRCRELSQYGNRVIHARQCKRCGKAFKTKTSRKHCSESCSKDSRREKSSETFANKRTAKCLACGKEFVARKKKYMTCCSRECGWELIKIRHRKTCDGCGIEFSGSGKQCDKCFIPFGRFGMCMCSCIDCGIAYPQPVKHQRKVTRCWQCREKIRIASAREWYKSIKGSVRIPGALSIHEYRAAKAGVPSEHVDVMEVFRRDNWTCQLCGKKTKASHDPHHPLRAVLDHIIPISKGGPHLYTNVQCAHRRCNGMKGDRMKREQMLLIG